MPAWRCAADDARAGSADADKDLSLLPPALDAADAPPLAPLLRSGDEAAAADAADEAGAAAAAVAAAADAELERLRGSKSWWTVSGGARWCAEKASRFMAAVRASLSRTGAECVWRRGSGRKLSPALRPALAPEAAEPEPEPEPVPDPAAAAPEAACPAWETGGREDPSEAGAVKEMALRLTPAPAAELERGPRPGLCPCPCA
jgi:hypothetical protein